MKTDGIFTCHQFEIPFNQYNKEEFYVIPLGDIHYNSPGCDRHKFSEVIKDISKPNHYILGMGDYLDSISSSERGSFSLKSLHDSTQKRIEQEFLRDTNEFIDKVKYFQDRCIGVTGGNHYFEFDWGATSDQIIAKELGAKYLGCSSLIQVRFVNTQSGWVHNVVFAINHGEGGGRTVGASMNKLQRMANNFEADIFLMGHDHNRAVDYINRLAIVNHSNDIRLVNKKILLGRTGSFLKSYQEGQPSYAVDANMSPSDLGVIRIKLKPRRTSRKVKGEVVDDRWIEIKATI